MLGIKVGKVGPLGPGAVQGTPKQEVYTLSWPASSIHVVQPG